MNLLELFTKRSAKRKRAENMAALRKKLSQTQENVYQAVLAIESPCNGRAIARHMQTDSASVTPRLYELVRKGRLRVAYSKRGLDGHWRKYYVTTARKRTYGKYA